jgi:hypothetical protein
MLQYANYFPCPAEGGRLGEVEREGVGKMAMDATPVGPVKDAADAQPPGRAQDPRDLAPVIDELMNAARAAVALSSAAGMQAARDLLVSAADLKQRLPAGPTLAAISHTDLTPEEWQKRYKPPA